MSIQSDDNSSINGLSEEAAEEAFLASLEPTEEGAKANDDAGNDEEETLEDAGNDEDEVEEPSNDDDEGETSEDEEPSNDEEPPAAPEINDDQELTFQLNGEDHKVTIGSLKRLAGQEANLTRKSQEAELVGARAAAALQAAIETVGEDFKPYANVDWLVLQQQMDPETFQWHRQNAASLQTKLQGLVGAAQGVEQTFAERKQNIDKEAAAAAVAELKADIPEWSDKLYGDIIQYGASQGLDAADLATVTNAKVIKLLRKAMLHDQASKIATQKVKTAPTKVIKGGSGGQPAPKQALAAKAMKRLQATGSDDAAVAALLGRWG